MPAVSSGPSQVLTFAFSGSNLDVLNVLINNSLDARQACYLAYQVSTNALFIVDDRGDASKLTGITMAGTGNVGNSQCRVDLNESSASVSGDVFTLVLNMSFSVSFGGNRVVYAAARDIAQNSSGWQTMGVHAVPPLPSTFPDPVGMNPSLGNASTAVITFSYKDQTSAANLQTVWAPSVLFRLPPPDKLVVPVSEQR
jgi:hypothetical protein